MMADSRSSVGARPLPWISACWVLRQLSFVMVAPLVSCSSRIGSCKVPGTGWPFIRIEGPIARAMKRLKPGPFTMNPPIPTLSPGCVTTRPEILRSSRSTGVGAGVALGVAVAVGVTVGAMVAVAVGVALGGTVAVAVGVAEGGTVGVAVGGIVAVGVTLGATVAVGVAVTTGVALGGTVAVGVGVGGVPEGSNT